MVQESDIVVVWKAEDGYRWHRQAANGEIMYGSSEAYEDLAYTIGQAKEDNPDISDIKFRDEDGKLGEDESSVDGS